MSVKKNTVPEYRRVTLVSNGAGLVAEYPWRTYRFMFSDGTTMDVTAVRDDSDLRGAVLSATKQEQICGVAVLAVTPPAEPVKKPVTKRVASRPASG